MLNVLREFVLDVLPGEASEASAEIPPLDDPRFSIIAGARSRKVRRTWLDTFDWRLFRAGLTLELVTGHGSAELALTGRDGELVAAERLSGPLAGSGDGGSRMHWPCKVQALPVGPLREHLTPVTGVRALLPVAAATSILSERRALNADDKTIAVVTIDAMVAGQPGRGGVPGGRPPGSSTGGVSGGQPPGSSTGGIPGRLADRSSATRVPARIAISPLRGYQAQASRLADLIAAAPGIAPATGSAFEAALAAAGRRPGDYTSKIDVELAGGMPAAAAFAVIFDSLFDAIEANLPGTLRDIDTEFLHDLRVAVRRTRSVLKLGGSVLPARLVSKYRPEFKWLGDLTTPTRDLDVYLLGYEAMSRQLIAATTADLLPFHDYLRAQRGLAYRQLARGLRSARFSALAAGWRRELGKLAAGPQRRPAIDSVAARRIARAHQRVLLGGDAVTAASAPQALHDLRKLCKELRYALEVFASLHDPAQQWRAVAELKALQDCLGEFQDTEVQRDELRSFATQMMATRSAPAETLLAMGEIAATLAARQRASRSEFAGRFADFASPRGRARIAALTEAAAAEAVPAKTMPAKTAPPKTAPAKTAPPKTAPAKTAPAKAAPAKTASSEAAS